MSPRAIVFIPLDDDVRHRRRFQRNYGVELVRHTTMPPNAGPGGGHPRGTYSTDIFGCADLQIEAGLLELPLRSIVGIAPTPRRDQRRSFPVLRRSPSLADVARRGRPRYVTTFAVMPAPRAP